MEQNRRTFPRIPFSEHALLEFTPAQKPGAKPPEGRLPERVTVLVSSASCEGMRLSRPTPIDNLVPGSRVEIVLYIDNQEVRLPGQAKWLVTTASGATNVGVALWLEVAQTAARRAWANRIVHLTQRHVKTQRRASQSHSVVRVARSAVKRAASNS